MANFFCARKISLAQNPFDSIVSALYITMLHTLAPKLLTAILSILQATRLRNRVYAMEDRLDILEVAIEDIERINARAEHPNPLITSICANVREHNTTVGEYLH